MPEIMSAKCTVCGKIFEGKDCIEKAEEHEKIEKGKPVYKIGDTLIYPKSSGYVNIHTINDIGFSQDDHKVTYNGFYDCKNVFKLPIIERDGLRIIYESDIFNSSIWADLRERFVELYVEYMLDNIDRNRHRFGIDKIVFSKQKGD